MANTSRINGFRPVKHLTGAPYSGQANIYEIVAGDGTVTNVGDLVKADSGTATDVYPTCVRHGPSGEVTSGLALGVIVGFVVDPTNLNVPQINTRAASTKRLALVADAPDLIFEVQDGGTVPCTLSLIGNNTGFLATVGSTVTGASGMTSGSTAPTTTNSLPLKIVGIVNAPDNASAAASQKLLVMINQHYYMGGQTAT
jgi:hypothetical protein